MARSLNLLTARGVENEKRPGRHADGGGLYLDINPDGRKSWVVLFRSPVHRAERKAADGTVKAIGKQREMGLGAFGTSDDRVSLAAARELAEAARKLLREGKDPLYERNRAAAPVKTVPTFGEVADQLIAAMGPSWKNDKHADQWRMTLKVYAAPLRAKPVDQIALPTCSNA